MPTFKNNMLMENEKEHLQVAVTQNDIRAIKKEVEQVSGKVNEVHQALIGSPLAQDGGMVQRLRDCENEIDGLRSKVYNMEKNTVKSDTYLRIIWACAGALVIAILDIISRLAFKK